MICLLTEKPSAARNFSKALGGVQGNYKGEAYTIVSALGHLFELAPPERQVEPSMTERYKRWTIDTLPWNHNDFAWRREKKDNAGKLPGIASAFKTCDEICIATDDDPTGEGSLLAWEIIEHIGWNGKKLTRMFFADEAASSLQKAFTARKAIAGPSFDPDYQKAWFRSRFDFLTMQFTRVASLCAGSNAVLRQGRLKSAMVSIVGDGLKALSEYKKIPFYQNRFRDENGNMYTDPDEPVFPSRDEVPVSYKDSDVVLDSEQTKFSAPPLLLDLAALSARLAPSGFKAKDILAVYQKMYENQVVSYPRTEDKHITSEQFNELLPHADAIAKIVGVNPKLLTVKQPRKTHVKEGMAHGANRPGMSVPASLDALKTSYGPIAPKIYELLARSYLAMLSADYEYLSQKGHVKDYPTFVATTQVPVSLGWKQVFNADDDDADNKNIGRRASPFVHEGFPPKPPTPTMKWLMIQLGKYDVGTGSTRTSTYADVTNEKTRFPLMIDTKGKITLTPFGETSYALLENTIIGNVATTEKLQADMRNIASGKSDADDLLGEVAGMVMSDLDTMKLNAQTKGLKSAGDYAQKEKVEALFKGKDIKFSREFGGHRFTDAEITDLLAGKIITVTCQGKDGTYEATGQLGEGNFKGKKFWGFQRQMAVKPDGVPDVFLKHEFTESEKRKLEAGEKIRVEGLWSNKKQSTFSAFLEFNHKKKEFNMTF